jgi:hypothetical protein
MNAIKQITAKLQDYPDAKYESGAHFVRVFPKSPNGFKVELMAGSLDVYATEQLEAKASGIGEINYYGNPKVVKKDASGIGSINQR